MASILATVAVTIGGELSVSFKDWLKSFTGHHWLTKSFLSLIVFALVFLLVNFYTREANAKKVKFSIFLLIIFALIGAAALVGFFIFEYLKV